MVKRAEQSKKEPNREELLQLAINAAKKGNNQPARLMFQQVLAQDKQNERALMWMAKLARSKEEQQEWLKRVLQVNPNNEAARQALQTMAYTSSARDNRTLLIFGAIAAVLVVISIVVLIALFASA